MKIKRLAIIGIAVVVSISITTLPITVYADFVEEGITLNIDTSKLVVEEQWQKIKNAALIHLVAQKFKTCINIGQMISIEDDTVWPSHTIDNWIIDDYDGVLDKGNVFKTGVLLSGDINTEVGVGPWMSRIINSNTDGTIKCNMDADGQGGLFDMFVYIVKNYKSGIKDNELMSVSSHVGPADRLAVVCNGSSPGLLQSYELQSREANTIDCNSSDVEWYTGVEKAKQLAYAGSIYDKMVKNSGNEYLKEWGKLDEFDSVDGYYLYSNDFEVQCGAEFDSKKGNDGGTIYKAGYKIEESGSVSKGYYAINSNTARASFTKVGNGNDNAKTLTCTDLVDKMNSYISEYIQFINIHTYDTCKKEITKKIDEKESEIKSKYLGSGSKSTSEEQKDAKAVISEYDRIKKEKEFTAKVDKDGNETLVKTAKEDKGSMPKDHILTCRSHLPYVDVEVTKETDLKDAIEDEFVDLCYDKMPLAWVTCPVIDAITAATDTLSELIDEIFE